MKVGRHLCAALFCLLLIYTEIIHAARTSTRRKSKRKKPTSLQPDDSCDLQCGSEAKLNSKTCRCVCPKGYIYDEYWGRCTDINECAENEGKCEGTCRNTHGSFHCTCGIGFILHSDGWQCTPAPFVIPCQALACYDGARLKVRKCVCECPEGLWYDFIEEKCLDTNECAHEDHGCDNCMNFHSGYACYCPEGYDLDLNNETCSESAYVSATELACENVECGAGASLDIVYCECMCESGFYYSLLQDRCVDDDECRYEYCGGTCTNKRGTYTCTCRDGLELARNGECLVPQPPEGVVCRNIERQCNDGLHCYYISTICDGLNDCEDGTDEENCKLHCYPEQFPCANGYNCIDSRLRCNGEDNCGDSSDEVDCGCMDFNRKCLAWSVRDECTKNPGFMQQSCRLSCEYCLEGDGTASGTLTVKDNAELYFLRHVAEYGASVQYVLRNSGNRRGQTRDKWSCNLVTDIPTSIKDEFGFSTFYKKYTNAYGIPIISSRQVSNEALMRACYVTRVLLSDQRMLRQAMYQRYMRIVVIADTEVALHIPEYAWLPPEYNDLTRGLGGTPHIPVISVAEENLLCNRDDPYKKEDILVKTLAHGIHRIALIPLDASRIFERHLENAYNNARRHNLWTNTINDDTVESYFAEGVQTFFDVQAPVEYGVHNDVNMRVKLKTYDPLLFKILKNTFPCMNHIINRCDDQSLTNTHTVKMNCEAVSLGTNPIVQDKFVPEYDPNCSDHFGSCAAWEERGECDANPDWMHENCPVSCVKCPIINIPPTVPPPIDADEDCEDSNEHCPAWAEIGECESNPLWMRPNCASSCYACGEDPLCFNQNERCEEWAADGNCESNAGYMGLYCQRVCGIC